MDLRGKTALVTGASSGIGEAYVRLLAARGANVVALARRKDRLDALAAEVSAADGVVVTALALDLTSPGAAQAAFAATEGAGTPVDILINNAGFGSYGYLADLPWERTAEMIDLNIRTLTELCYRFIQPMRARGLGFVQNVASIGAFTPSPDYAAYCATKAYVLSLSEGVSFELRNTGVVVSCLCPGFTTTEFHQVAGHKLPKWQKSSSMTAEKCAEIGLNGLLRGKRVVVPGISNKIAAFSTRLTPRWAVLKSAEMMIGKAPADRELDRPKG